MLATAFACRLRPLSHLRFLSSSSLLGDDELFAPGPVGGDRGSKPQAPKPTKDQKPAKPPMPPKRPATPAKIPIEAANANANYPGYIPKPIDEERKSAHFGTSLSKHKISAETLEKYRKQARKLTPYVPDEKGDWNEFGTGFDANEFNAERGGGDKYDNRGLKWEHLALKDIHSLSYEVHTLVEVRDARIPASSHHPSFSRLARHRRHLIVYTHADALDLEAIEKVARWTDNSWPDARYMFVDVREQRSAPAHFKELKDWICWNLEERGGETALTVGVPNVGKSAMLMALLRDMGKKVKAKALQKAKKAGGKKKGGPKKAKVVSKPGIQNRPGFTRELTKYLLRETGKTKDVHVANALYCVDVPGISPPPFFFQERPEAYLALAAYNTLLNRDICDAGGDEALQEECVAYVLKRMNEDGLFGYVEKLALKGGPTNDPGDVVEGMQWGERKKPASYCYANFITQLRGGSFGPVVLDDLRRPYSFFDFKAVP